MCLSLSKPFKPILLFGGKVRNLLWFSLALHTNIRLGSKDFQGTQTLAYFGHSLLNKKPNNIKHFSMASLLGLDKYLQVWLGAYRREVLLSYAPLRLALALIPNIRMQRLARKNTSFLKKV